MPLDIAASARPATPVNKKRRVAPGDFDEETGKVVTHAEADFANRPAAKGGTLGPQRVDLGQSPPPPPLRGQSYVDEQDSQSRLRDYLDKHRSPRLPYTPQPEPEAAPFTGSTAPFTSSELDSGTADFRARRSARDRMLGGNGLNVGRTGNGEVLNPMMPGAAGMGAGPSQVNPMMGDKAAWYVNRANQEPYNPDTANRQQRLLDLASGGSAPAKQWEQSGEWPFNRGDVPMDMGGSTENTAANRIDALKDIGGLAGASRAGLMDRFVSGSSLTRGPNDTPERTLQLDKIAAIRQGEKQRKLDLRGNVNDPTSIAGRIATRGAQKGFDRQQRMADRARGPSQEDMILRGAMNGNPSALRLADMMAQGNRERGIGRDRNQALRDVAGIEFPQPTSRMQGQADASLYNDYLGGGGKLPPDEWRQQFGGEAAGGGGKPPAWMFDEAGEPIDQERFDQLATIYNLPPEDRDRLRGALKPKSVPLWRRTTPSSPPSMPPSSYVGRGY